MEDTVKNLRQKAAAFLQLAGEHEQAGNEPVAAKLKDTAARLEAKADAQEQATLRGKATALEELAQRTTAPGIAAELRFLAGHFHDRANRLEPAADPSGGEQPRKSG